MVLEPTLCAVTYDREYLERERSWTPCLASSPRHGAPLRASSERHWTPFRVPSAPAYRRLEYDGSVCGCGGKNGSCFDFLYSDYLKQSYATWVS